MHSELVDLNHSAVLLLIRATVNLSWYYSTADCATNIFISGLTLGSSIKDGCKEGGRGVKGKGTRADIGGRGSSKGGRPQKNFEES